MGKSCFVPNCRSGYLSCREIVSIFSTPLDPQRLEIWRKNIPRSDRVLSCKDKVCAKHFESKYIIREWNNGLTVVPLDKPRLTNDAIPTIFPGCPSYLNIKNKTRRPLIRDDEIPKRKRRKIKLVEDDTNNLPSTSSNNSSEINLNVEGYDLDSRKNEGSIMFEELWSNNCCSLKLPNELWSFHKVYTQDHANRYISFSKMFVAKNTTLPRIERQVVIDANFNTKVVVFGSEIPHNIIQKENTSLQDIISQVNAFNICLGGPTFAKYDPSCTYSECAIPDHALQIWRHIKCSFVHTSLKCCSFCSTLANTMRMHNYRRRKVTLKVRAKSLLDNKTQIASLRKIKNKRTRITLKAKRKINILTKELVDIKIKMKNVSEENLEKYINDNNLPEQQKILIKECFKLSKVNSKNGKRYSNDWLLYCLLLHIRSPTTYQFMMYNNILPLPSPTTIRRYLAKVNIKCGLDESFFKALKLKLCSKNKFQRHGILLFDEMQVRKSIKINTKTMELTGIVDFGDDIIDTNTTYELADHALVFMFCPLADNYAQPVAVYAAKGATKGTILASLIVRIIQELEKAGAKIDGIICDGASTNRRMWKEFGISGSFDNPSNKCVHPVDENRNLFFFSDTPHLFKCIRNRIYEKGHIKLPNGEARWKHYETVYKEDLKLPGNLKVCPKISNNHIYLSSLLKMRVKLATQVFSNSMSNALIFYKQKNVQGLIDADTTISFTKRMNDLFDSLNRKFAKEQIKLGSPDITQMKEGLKWLNEWEKCLNDKVIDANEFLSKSTAEGLRVTLLSTVEIIEWLISKEGFSYVLTNKFNQDPLEQFFGTIRQAGGCNDHPSFSSFIQLYRMLSVYKLIKPPRFGNCTFENSEIDTLNFEKFNLIFKSKTTNHIHDIEAKLEQTSSLCNEEDHEELLDQLICSPAICSNDVSDAVLYYIGGFLIRKLRKTTTCSICRKGLATDQSIENISIADLTNLKTQGFLTHPTIEMFYLFKNAEKIFLSNIKSKFMYEETINDCINTIDFKFPCDVHKLNIFSQVLHHFVLIRMRQYFKIEDSKTKSGFKEKNKMSKLQSK